jgi:hypothetical protein
VTWAIAGQRWVQWGVQAMPPKTSARTSFADLANITVTAQCIQDGTEVAACDPYGRPYQPYVVLPARVLAAFGLGPDATGALGVALAALYVLVVAGLGLVLARLWQGRVLHLIGAQVLLGILAVAPPALLAVERGQIEILTLALSVVGLLALSSDRMALGVSGAVAAGAAVATKFFAIGVFAPFLQRGRRNLPALAALAASVALLALNWQDIQLASDAAGADAPATSKSQFGAFALVATFRSADPVDFIPSPAVVAEWPTVKLTGWAVVLIALTMAAVLVRPQQVRDLAGRHWAHALILGSAADRGGARVAVGARFSGASVAARGRIHHQPRHRCGNDAHARRLPLAQGRTRRRRREPAGGAGGVRGCLDPRVVDRQSAGFVASAVSWFSISCGPGGSGL